MSWLGRLMGGFVKCPEKQTPIPASRAEKHRILILADGTCNAFGRNESNVVKLLKHVQLGRLDRDEQIAVYDQGLGSQIGQHKKSLEFKSTVCSDDAFTVLAPPNDSPFWPSTIPRWVRAMTHGEGLADNVKQLYMALAQRYQPGSEVFCFGFSRGAFTVRALAAMTWRFGVPSSNEPGDASERFETFWPQLERAYLTRSVNDRGAVTEPQHGPGARPCPIRFMGLWDTVKSYGGIVPRVLPHLRHNPSVEVVRHALALDERRAWFEATTWGWLDSDRGSGHKSLCQPGRCPRAAVLGKEQVCGNAVAASRLEPVVIEQIKGRNVAEVWFKGSHSDIGGGSGNTPTSDIALRWMLGEAHCFGLLVNDDGRRLLSVCAEDEYPVIKDSRGPLIGYLWRAIDRLDRKSISNAGKWPEIFDATPGPIARQPCKSARGGEVLVHESAIAYFNSTFTSCDSLDSSIRSVQTQRLGTSETQHQP